MKLLTPTSNRRWNELVGVVWMAVGLLLLLSLASFSSNDSSFNSASGSATVQNWVGNVGAYTADLLYQFFGACAFLLPLWFAWVGWQWFRSQSVDSAGAKCAGAILLFASLLAALALVPYPLRLHQAFPAGGLVGILLAAGLRKSLNGPGSAVLVTVTMLASLYLLTAFSMTRFASWLQAHFGWIGRLRTKWLAWLEARAQKREEKKAAQQPVMQPVVQPPISVEMR